MRAPYIGAYRLAVLTGIRPGELHGLRWSDLAGRKLTIHHAITTYNEITQGKNKNAVRPILLSDLAMQIINEQRLYTGDEPFIFPITTQRTYREHWKRYCKSNNIPYVTPYELRHTFVSVAQVLPEGQVKQIGATLTIWIRSVSMATLFLTKSNRRPKSLMKFLPKLFKIKSSVYQSVYCSIILKNILILESPANISVCRAFSRRRHLFCQSFLPQLGKINIKEVEARTARAERVRRKFEAAKGGGEFPPGEFILPVRG